MTSIAEEKLSPATAEVPAFLPVDEEVTLHRIKSLNPTNSLFYGIAYEDYLVGKIGFYNWIQSSAYMSYTLYQDEGQRIASRAAHALRDIGFNSLKLDHIKLFIDTSNERSRRVAISLGAKLLDSTAKSQWWGITRGNQ